MRVDDVTLHMLNSLRVVPIRLFVTTPNITVEHFLHTPIHTQTPAATSQSYTQDRASGETWDQTSYWSNYT